MSAEAEKAVRDIALLIIGNCPMWATQPDAYSCDADQVHRVWITEFVDDLHAIVYPFAPDLLVTPEKWVAP